MHSVPMPINVRRYSNSDVIDRHIESDAMGLEEIHAPQRKRKQKDRFRAAVSAKNPSGDLIRQLRVQPASASCANQTDRARRGRWQKGEVRQAVGLRQRDWG
jgi:hypothetical protein